MLYLIALLSLSPGAFADDACGAPPRPHSPDRYEDFYRIRRHAEERELARDQGRAEIAGRDDERQRKLEEGRLHYIRTRRKAPDDAEGEAEWKATLGERQRKIEEARRCYVSRRDQAEKFEHRGRVVPGDVEYGLDE